MQMQKVTFAITIPHFISRLYLHSLQKNKPDINYITFQGSQNASNKSIEYLEFQPCFCTLEEQRSDEEEK